MCSHCGTTEDSGRDCSDVIGGRGSPVAIGGAAEYSGRDSSVAMGRLLPHRAQSRLL